MSSTSEGVPEFKGIAKIDLQVSKHACHDISMPNLGTVWHGLVRDAGLARGGRCLAYRLCISIAAY